MWISQPHQRDHKLSISATANLYNVQCALQPMAKSSVKSGISYLCHANDSVGMSLLELLVDRLQSAGASQAAGDEGALLVRDLQQMVELLWPVSWLPQKIFHVQPLRNATCKWGEFFVKTESSNL